MSDFAKSEWVVVYRSHPGARETRSPSAPSERRALAQARTLHFLNCEIIRIDGPAGATIAERRLNDWLANGRDRLGLAE
jgi:hypothetical protein